MDPQGAGTPFVAEPVLVAVDSDFARIAQAAGLLMERYGLDTHGALALLFTVSWLNSRIISSVARELVEHV